MSAVVVLIGASATANSEQITPPKWKGGGRVDVFSVSSSPRDNVVLFEVSVAADGSTTDVESVGGFYDESYRRAALTAVKRLKYEPATRDGVPVESFGYRFTLTRRVSVGFGGSPGFRASYDEVQKLVTAGEFGRAEAEIQRLLKDKAKTVFEYSFLNEALVPIYVHMGRASDALMASRAATLKSGAQDAVYQYGTRILANDPSWPFFLPREILVTAWKQRFSLSMALNLYGEAAFSYSQLAALEPIPDGDEMTRQFRSIPDLRKSGEPLLIKGKLLRGAWEFSPVRRRISISSPSDFGVKQVSAVCNFHKESFQLDGARELYIPPAWGGCVLKLYGSTDSEFVISQRS